MADNNDDAPDDATPEQCSLIAMGRSVQLGGYYDAATETLFPPTVSPTAEDIETELVSKVEVVTCSANDIWKHLEVDPELRLKILLGLCKIETGALQIPQILDKKCEHAFLIYKDKRLKRYLKECPGERSGDVNPDGTTHLIKSVEIGAWIVFHFQYPGTREKFQSLLSELVEDVPKMKTLRSLQNKEKKNFAKAIKCDVYSDVPIPNPAQNFEEAVELFQKLPKLVEGADVVVKGYAEQICGAVSFPIVEATASQIAENILCLMAFCLECEQHSVSDVFSSFNNFKKKIYLFKDTVDLYLEHVKNDIARRLKQVKSGTHGEGLLDQAIPTMDESPFQLDSLIIWLSDLTRLDAILYRATKTNKYPRQAEACRTNGSGNTIRSRDPADLVAVFHVGFTQQELEHINNMNKYLVENNVIPEECEPGLAVLEGSTTSMNEKLKSILNMVPEKKSQSGLVITDDVSDNQALINIYQNGELLMGNFVPPTKMEAPNCTNVTHESMRITWIKPSAEGVLSYEVKFKTSYEKDWNGTCHSGTDKNEVTVYNLRPGRVYYVKVRPLSKLGPGSFSAEMNVITHPAGRPSRPKALQVSSKGCVLTWYPSEDIFRNYRGACIRPDILSWKIEVQAEADENYVIYSDVYLRNKADSYINLEGGGIHRFRVCAFCRFSDTNQKKIQVEGQYSEWSEEFTMNASSLEIIKNKALLGSHEVSTGNPCILNLKTKADYIDRDLRHRKFYHGRPTPGVPMKTILMVGATGAGKSTLINALVNYVLNVKWEDDFRFRLVRENLNADHANSQTKWVTAYTIYHQKGFNIPYSLNIIDTPGFGDTAGIEADKRITEQLSAYFHTRGHEGIDSLDAIGFVVEASRPRLTATQIYIFDSILALFGKDISENIFMLITFADGQKPPVLDGLKKANLPYTHAFKFNNSAVFAQKQTQEDDEFDDDNQSFDEMFWKMGAQSYKKFLTSLQTTSPKSLTLTVEVLDERDRLEAHVTGIQQEIRAGLYKLEGLRRGLRCLYDCEADAQRSKDYTYQVPVQKSEKVKLNPGSHVTNCLHCNRTCHYPCYIPRDEDKSRCAAMCDRGSESASCEICPGNCHWSLHHNMSYRFEFEEIIETRTAEDLKRQYEVACEARLTTEQVIEKMLEDVQEIEIRTAAMTEEVRLSLKKLNAIALKPNHMTTVGYIDVLIQSEREQAEPGWQHRVNQLKAVRERADMLGKVAEEKGITDVWGTVKRAIKQDAEERKKGGIVERAKNMLTKYLRKAGIM